LTQFGCVVRTALLPSKLGHVRDVLALGFGTVATLFKKYKGCWEHMLTQPAATRACVGHTGRYIQLPRRLHHARLWNTFGHEQHRLFLILLINCCFLLLNESRISASFAEFQDINIHQTVLFLNIHWCFSDQFESRA
jgi:hypothetical protein